MEIVLLLGAILGFVLFIFFIIVLLALRYKMKHSEKSWTMAMLDSVLSPMRAFDLGPYINGTLTIEKMMNEVTQEVGLSDFGDLSFLSSYQAAAALPDFRRQHPSNLGYILAMAEMKLALSRKLRAIAYFKANPSVLNIPVKQPVFVFGLPRKTLSFLQRLLALDPAARAPSLWELVLPVPDLDMKAETTSAEDFVDEREHRKKFVHQRIREREVMGDNVLADYHDLHSEEPGECTFALADELPLLVHYLSTTLSNWSSLRKELPASNFLAAYHWYRKILQLLAMQTGDRQGEKRWILKCPLHLFLIPELAQVFPDAKLIW